jgi:hypothetical protein
VTCSSGWPTQAFYFEQNNTDWSTHMSKAELSLQFDAGSKFRNLMKGKED